MIVHREIMKNTKILTAFGVDVIFPENIKNIPTKFLGKFFEKTSTQRAVIPIRKKNRAEIGCKDT